MSPRIVLQIFTDEDLRSEIGAVARTQVGISLLYYRIPTPLMGFADRVGFRNAPQGKIAGADGSHFAGLDQTIKGFHGFFKRRVAIVTMRIVDVDPIRLQPFEALLAFALDLGCAESAFASGKVETQLGGNNHLLPVAPLLHPRTNGGLALTAFAAGQPARIHIRGVNQRAAVFAEEIEEVKRGPPIDSAANQVAAHGQRTHFDIRSSQLYLLHEPSSRLIV